MLKIDKLAVEIEGKPILKKLDLSLGKGESHALMGPNGSGKSTLAHVIMGDPTITISDGKILLDDKDISNISPDERAKLGLFLLYQSPVEVPGVRLSQFLRLAYMSVKDTQIEVEEFRAKLTKIAKSLDLDDGFIDRELNAGLSGGEKKKMEMLQMLVLEPKYIIVDEVDSGLDIDALRVVALCLNTVIKNGASLLIITHYKRILEYVKPDTVSILKGGEIVASGDAKLVDDVEKLGYDPIKKS